MPDTTQDKFGDRLKRLRQARGMTQVALAGATGCTATFVRQIEAGRKRPSLKTLKALAGALSVTEAELLEGRVPNTKERDNG